MIEACVVIDLDGNPIRWHDPRHSAVKIPDSDDLWEFLYENRGRVAGIAHTHPGSGMPSPSWTDVTTFAAIESGLSRRPFRRLKWWIASSDRLVVAEWVGPGQHDYGCRHLDAEPEWTAELRHRSEMVAAGT